MRIWIFCWVLLLWLLGYYFHIILVTTYFESLRDIELIRHIMYRLGWLGLEHIV